MVNIKNQDRYQKHMSWRMFDNIAKRYNFLNNILSAGVLPYWRNQLIKQLPKKENLSILDCATGTGEVMFSIMKKHQQIQQITGLDLAENMMAIGKEKQKVISL